MKLDYVQRFFARLGVVAYFLLAFFLPACVADPFIANRIDAADSEPPDSNMADSNDGGMMDAPPPSDSPSADSPTADSAPADAGSDACVTESGVTACGRALDQWCSRAVACGLMQSVQACRSWLNVNFNGDFDCQMNAKYNKVVCTTPTDKCVGDLGAVSCNTIQTKTPAQAPPSCASFFGQF